MAIEERNDALKNQANIPLNRYKFASFMIPQGLKLIADLGCGLGYGSKLLRDAGHKVLGVDNSDEAIEYAKDNYPGEYLCADIEDSSLEALFEFEGAVILEALCHLKDPEKFLDNLNVEHLVVSAPIDPNPDDGYIYRLHNLSEEKFRSMVSKKWNIIDELWQNVGPNENYLVLYARKNSNNLG